MRYFTSDLHLGHANIIRFCNRPYRNGEVGDVEEMNADIIARINAAAGPSDEVWILGDVAMGNLDDTVPLIEQLHAGRKVLVAGNHDRVHPSNKNQAAKHAWRYDVFDEVHTTNTHLTLANGEEVNVSHFPYTLTANETRASEPTDRFAPWRVQDDGKWLLCGHVHDAWARHGKTINVGIDAWGGHILPETAIIEMIETGPAHTPATPWNTP